MAYKLDNPRNLEYIPSQTSPLNCYDTIIESEWGHPDDFDYDRDETLHKRSYFEFIRDQLTNAQQADLDMIDAFWKAHPKEFNAAFGRLIGWSDKKTEMEDFGIIDEATGKAPPIPKSHWWWQKLEEKG